jgi:hypothetical protein
MSVELDVRTFLAITVASTSSGMFFVGPIRKTTPNKLPAPGVFIMEYGGPPPHQFQSGGTQPTYRRTNVQIRVQSPINGYLTGKALADRIWSAMDHPSNATLTGISSGSRQYVFVRPLQSAPVYIGQNDTEQDQFSINVGLEYGGG